MASEPGMSLFAGVASENSWHSFLLNRHFNPDLGENRTRGMLPGFMYPYKLVNSDLSHSMHAASGGLLLSS